MCIAEETGEAVQAYRQGTGRARPHGDWPTFPAELADVVIVARVTAELASIDLDAAVYAMRAVIEARGGVLRTRLRPVGVPRADRPRGRPCSCAAPPPVLRRRPPSDSRGQQPAPRRCY